MKKQKKMMHAESRTASTSSAAAAALLTVLSLAPPPASTAAATSASVAYAVVPPHPSRGLASCGTRGAAGLSPGALSPASARRGICRSSRRGTGTPSFIALASRAGTGEGGDDASSAFRGSGSPPAGRLANKSNAGMSPSALSFASSSTAAEATDAIRRRPVALRATPASATGKNRRRKKGTALGAGAETEISPSPAATDASTEERDDPDPKPKVKWEKSSSASSPSSSPSSSYPLSFREDVLDHRLLTKEEEIELATRIHRGTALREKMTELVEEKMMQLADPERQNSVSGESGDVEKLSDLPFLAESRAMMMGAGAATERRPSADLDPAAVTFDPINPPVTYREESLLTELDCVSSLDLPGGRAELRRILQEASDARQTLVKCNMKLVVSIAKKWLSMGSSSDRHNSYDGGWDTASLDELVQEGVLGLNRAAEKYDPERGVRFSTYSTHWISAYVRTCVRDRTTSCLKVPYALHEIKRAYKAIMRNAHVEAPHDPLPTTEAVAQQIGVSPERLASALAVTRTVLSIDAPLFGGSGGTGGGGGGGAAGAKGSGAGGDTAGVDQQLTLADALRSTETSPEEFVDLSFLRQCLENAMAAELSPHERDVVRLRLGLDDGHSKTAREVVDVCGGAISMADVRTAERRAYKKLRSPNAVHTYDLLSFLDPADVDYNMYSRPRF